MILIVAAIQIVVVYLLGDRDNIVPRRASSASAFTLLSNPSTGSAVGELVQLGDPTLFALPDVRGFSGRAWLVPPPLTRSESTWSEPDGWLTQSVVELGTELEDFGRRNRLRYRIFDEKPPPLLSRVMAPPVPFPDRSSVRVEASGNRVLLALPDVPSITNSDVLSDTVVQVGITPTGLALTSVVLEGSGSTWADDLALNAAQQVRFKPLAVRDPLAMTWAILSFRWHTVPPSPTTNAAAGGAPP
jgi:hypothetical protein